MKKHDPSEKDAKAPTNLGASAAPEAGTTDSTEKELTDAELAAIAGGTGSVQSAAINPGYRPSPPGRPSQ